jgi:IMP dehydrogenase
MKDKSKVKEYMRHDFISIEKDETVKTAKNLIQETEKCSIPVSDGTNLYGCINASDLIGSDENTMITELIEEEVLTAKMDMDIPKAARVMLRRGRNYLPVTDENDNMTGIIKNKDIIRSQIERVTPNKIRKLVNTLEEVHSSEVTIRCGEVKIDNLIPTQNEVYSDELEGRKYELQKGLSEQIITISSDDAHLIADGHHRACAASELDIDSIDAYIITVNTEKKLGLEETAASQGLSSIDDINMIESSHHPIISKTRVIEE